jgi:hypothetical protein
VLEYEVYCISKFNKDVSLKINAAISNDALCSKNSQPLLHKHKHEYHKTTTAKENKNKNEIRELGDFKNESKIYRLKPSIGT